MTMTNFLVSKATQFGNGLYANLTINKVALLDCSPASWHAFAEGLSPDLEGFQSSPLNYMKAERQLFRDVRNGLLAAQSEADIEAIISSLLDAAATWGDDRSSVRKRTGVRYLLAKARWHDLVLLPAGILKAGAVEWLAQSVTFDPPSPARTLYATLRETIKRHAPSRINKPDCQLIEGLFIRFCHFVQFDDVAHFDEKFFEAFWAFLSELKKHYNSGKDNPTAFSRMQGLFNNCFEFIYAHERENGREIAAPPQFTSAYWRRQAGIADAANHHSFRWWTDEQPQFCEWAAALSWFVNNTPRKQPEYVVHCLKKFCLYLNTLQNPPLHPLNAERSLFIRRDKSPPQTFYEYLQAEGADEATIGYQTVLMLKAFFDRWHDEFALERTDWSNPVKQHDLDSGWNRGSAAAKTNKEVLPVRLIKLMRQIITEADFAWPKMLQEDYISWYSPEDGKYQDIWSPTRAIGLLFLLTVPIRTIQMRLLDSGEGDEFIPDLASYEHQPNASKLAEKDRQEGVLKRIWDGSKQRYYVGLHITTNKTGKVGTSDFETPYDIPWECEELIPYLVMLKEWQSQYNPPTRKLTRRDVSDKGLHPNDAVKTLPGYYFLFRDPANKVAAKDEPVSHGRMRIFFLKCLQEAQKRLRAEGEDVTVVWVDENRNLQSNYTLHGLRASGITHFVEAGVPIQVVAEFVAGHATLLMTLHYARFSAGYITDIIDKALRVMEEGEEEEFVNLLGQNPFEQLPGLVASNSEDGVRMLADTSPGTWSISLDGICPVGRALCNEGGERVSSHNNPYYAPVPFGPRNCAQCRFFITGDVFLNGQVIAFNNWLFAISEKAKDLNRIKTQVAEAEAKGSKGRKLERIRTQVVVLEKEIDLMLQSLQARFILIEKSRLLMRNGDRAQSDKHQLISLSSQEDLQIVLESTSEFDLLDFVAQSCEVFPEKSEPSAPLRKGKILDQFLSRNGYEPLFYALTENDALAAGNKLTRFLTAKIGRDRLRSLMDGHVTLRNLGIATEFETAAGQILNTAHLCLEHAASRRTPMLNG